MGWLETIPEPYYSRIRRQIRPCRTFDRRSTDSWIDSIIYEPRGESHEIIKSCNIYIQISSHYQYWLSFQQESNGTTRIFRSINQKQISEFPAKQDNCGKVSLEWLVHFFEETFNFRFRSVTLTPAAAKSIGPLIQAHKICLNGDFHSIDNQIVGWWLSHFHPNVYSVKIFAENGLVRVRHHEHLKRAGLLYLKGYTDVNRDTLLNFEGVYLRIDDWNEPPLNYDGNTVVTLLEKWLGACRKRDLIINSEWIDYEFWEPIERYLKRLAFFESDENKLKKLTSDFKLIFVKFIFDSTFCLMYFVYFLLVATEGFHGILSFYPIFHFAFVAIVISGIRSLLATLISLERLFATITPMLFFIHRSRIKSHPIIIIILAHAFFDYSSLFFLCNFEYEKLNVCWSVNCVLSQCSTYYLFGIRSITGFLTFIFSAILVITNRKNSKITTSIELRRANTISIIDGFSAFFLEFIPNINILLVLININEIGVVTYVLRILDRMVQAFLIIILSSKTSSQRNSRNSKI